MPGSGCYGHNGADDVAFEASVIAKEYPDIPLQSLMLQMPRHQHRYDHSNLSQA